MEPKKVYFHLMEEYGPQGWWPLTPPGESRTRHHAGRPKNDSDRFEIIIGAILTQNTSWNNVEKSLEQLHKKGIMNCEGILATGQKKLSNIIRSSGYHNQKAERLLVISRFLKQEGIKNLAGKDLSKLRKMLLSINGIGPETADSILLYAFEKPSFVIDTYTKRIFSRIGICQNDADYHSLQDLFMKNLPGDVELYKEFHALIVRHAKNSCKAKPVCEGCVLRKSCTSAKKPA